MHNRDDRNVILCIHIFLRNFEAIKKLNISPLALGGPWQGIHSLHRTSCTLYLMSFRDNSLRILFELGGCEELKKKVHEFCFAGDASCQCRYRGEGMSSTAALYGHPLVVQFFCEQGADKDVRDKFGLTPLQYAAARATFPVKEYTCGKLTAR